MNNNNLLDHNLSLTGKTSITPHQVILVQKSWKVFRDIRPEIVGDVFYSKLFSDMPSLKRLFKNPMTAQYKKLIDMISMIVGRLQTLNEVTEDIRQLAKRHVTYGVKSRHYPVVGNALLWTLERGLGNDWNEETQKAWTVCYSIIADTMKRASEY